jgi:hypothetical protein
MLFLKKIKAVTFGVNMTQEQIAKKKKCPLPPKRGFCPTARRTAR